MNAIAAIVVTYNRKVLLDECLTHLEQLADLCDILLVDNASTDGTPELVQQHNAENLHYFNTGKNIGGAGGFNFGLRKAYEMGYQYFWLMDDDTMVERSSLEELLRCDRVLKGNYGFLSSQALWIDGSHCVMNYHTIADYWEEDAPLLQEQMIPIQAATFVSFFTRREVVEAVGLPIRDYFIWGDDTEYSLRIAKHFPDCYYCYNSFVVHKMKANQATGGFEKMTDPERIERMRISVRNDFCTAKRRGFKKVIRNMIQTFKILYKCITTSDCLYRGKKISILFLGTLDGIAFHPPIEQVSHSGQGGQA